MHKPMNGQIQHADGTKYNAYDLLSAEQSEMLQELMRKRTGGETDNGIEVGRSVEAELDRRATYREMIHDAGAAKQSGNCLRASNPRVLVCHCVKCGGV